METVISKFGTCVVDDKDLEELFMVFGEMYSHEDIASAYYCKANRNKQDAAEFLCGKKGRAEEDHGTSYKVYKKCDNGRAEKSQSNRGLKLKKCPAASMGTVSGIIAKEYVSVKPLASGFLEARKPLKLDAENIPASELWRDESEPAVKVRDENVQAGLEEFLFQMLGKGFQLEMNVIREVLGQCGYDMQKCVDELLNLSASALKKDDDSMGRSSVEYGVQYSDEKSSSSQQQRLQLESAHNDGVGAEATSVVESQGHNDMVDLQKEVLQTLFTVPDRSEEPKKLRSMRPPYKWRSRALGRLVYKQFKEDNVKQESPVAKPRLDMEKEVEDDENSYRVLCEAARDYWTTMREYYKAAVEAFMKGDHDRAQRLLLQGQFFHRKAKEADERSCQKLIEAKYDDLDEEVCEDDIISLDLHDFDPKESLRMLRRHLTSVSGIPAIKCLRVILESDDGDCRNASRRKLVLKQLEKESIQWSEEDSGRAIVIRVDKIDPKRLSFAKHYEVGDNSRPLPLYGGSKYYL